MPGPICYLTARLPHPCPIARLPHSAFRPAPEEPVRWGGGRLAGWARAECAREARTYRVGRGGAVGGRTGLGVCLKGWSGRRGEGEGGEWGGGAQDDVRVHAGGAVVRGGIDAVAVATASAMESRRSRTTSMAEARSQACSDRGQVRRCWAARSCDERLRARGADHTVSAAHSAGGTHDPVSRDHDAPLDGMATRCCPLLRRKCYESDRRQKEERTEGRRKDGAGLDMRLSREAASLPASHRLA